MNERRPRLCRAARLNTAIVGAAPNPAAGTRNAFRVDTILAVGGLAVAALLIGGPVDPERLRDRRHTTAPTSERCRAR